MFGFLVKLFKWLLKFDFNLDLINYKKKVHFILIIEVHFNGKSLL